MAAPDTTGRGLAACRVGMGGTAVMTLLDHYVGAIALKAIVLVAATLTTLFSLLEFVNQLHSVGQGHYRLIDALVYVLLTSPSRLLQLAPVSVLLGSLLALGALARRSELMAFRSLGISEVRIVAPVMKLAVPVVIALFLLAEFIIPPAQQLAQSQRMSALSSSESIRSSSSIWAHRDYQYLNVREFEYGNIPKDIDIYEFFPEGDMNTVIHADQADIQPDGTWLLTGVLKKSIHSSQFQTEHLDSLTWSVLIPTDLLVLPPETMPPVALYRYVRDLKQRHQQALRYEQELWTKISIPLSIIAMIMITAPFVCVPPRAQKEGQKIMIGAIFFSMVFSLCQQIVRHLTLLLGLNPIVTALALPLMTMALAINLFDRARR
jgi:lipopolysaccharide export system permease protein